jgi:hypothetical protein
MVAIQKSQQLKIEAHLLLDEALSAVKTVSSMEPEFKNEFIERFHHLMTNLEEPIDLENIETETSQEGKE